MPDYFMLNHIKPITSLAVRNNVPAIYPWRSVVTDYDALFSYGPDLRDEVRQVHPTSIVFCEVRSQLTCQSKYR